MLPGLVKCPIGIDASTRSQGENLEDCFGSFQSPPCPYAVRSLIKCLQAPSMIPVAMGSPSDRYWSYSNMGTYFVRQPVHLSTALQLSELNW